VKARVVIVSFALHITILIGVLVARTAVSRPTMVDIEVVPPAATFEAAPPPPRIAPTATPNGNPVSAPPHPGPPARALHRRPDGLPAHQPAAPPTADVEPGPPAVAPPDDGPDLGNAGNGAGLGGRGSGGGDGDGNGDIDLSARPVPLNAGDVTLPYTEEAARRRISGNVIVELSIDPVGRVQRATIARRLGYGLDELAIRTAMQLRFRPAHDRAGRPTAATVRWRVHFDPP
jgi:TonB family protein